MRAVVKTLATVASIALAVITIALVALTISRARLPYENGRYFDPIDSVIYDESAVAVYGLLAAIFAIVTAVALCGTVRLWTRG